VGETLRYTKTAKSRIPSSGPGWNSHSDLDESGVWSIRVAARAADGGMTLRVTQESHRVKATGFTTFTETNTRYDSGFEIDTTTNVAKQWNANGTTVMSEEEVRTHAPLVGQTVELIVDAEGRIRLPSEPGAIWRRFQQAQLDKVRAANPSVGMSEREARTLAAGERAQNETLQSELQWLFLQMPRRTVRAGEQWPVHGVRTVWQDAALKETTARLEVSSVEPDAVRAKVAVECPIPPPWEPSEPGITKCTVQSVDTSADAVVQRGTGVCARAAVTSSVTVLHSMSSGVATWSRNAVTTWELVP
jgi:hypothetical protein